MNGMPKHVSNTSLKEKVQVYFRLAVRSKWLFLVSTMLLPFSSNFFTNAIEPGALFNITSWSSAAYMYFLICVIFLIVQLAHSRELLSSINDYQEDRMQLITPKLLEMLLQIQTFSTERKFELTQKPKFLSSIEEASNIWGFKLIAQETCLYVRDLALVFDEEAQFRVTFFQRCEVEHRDSLQMIGHAAEAGYQQSSLYKTFPLQGELLPGMAKPHFHTRIVRADPEDSEVLERIVILADNAEVRASFCFDGRSEERELTICQYIGIPVFTADNQIIGLLQIDTDKPNCFGDNKETIRAWAEHLFLPFAVDLADVYEEERLLAAVHDYFNLNSLP